MADFNTLTIGKDKENILQMIDELREAIKTAGSIPACELQSYSNICFPHELNIVIKIKLCGTNNNG